MEKAKRIAVRKMKEIFPDHDRMRMVINGHRFLVVRDGGKVRVIVPGEEDDGKGFE